MGAAPPTVTEPIWTDLVVFRGIVAIKYLIGSLLGLSLSLLA